VDFVMYSVRDMKRSQKFYRELFGLRRGEEWNSFWSEFATGPVAEALCRPSRTWNRRGPGAVAIAVDDVYAAVEYLRGQGVKVLNEPVETSVCHVAFVADPDGNRVCIHARKDGTAG
jgi:catechol 2,3-dioxygenase-like lactoylglutathione lyase family enzyme